MSFWRVMPKGMRLRSNMSATNMVEPNGPLSLASFMQETGETFASKTNLRRRLQKPTTIIDGAHNHQQNKKDQSR